MNVIRWDTEQSRGNIEPSKDDNDNDNPSPALEMANGTALSTNIWTMQKR